MQFGLVVFCLATVPWTLGQKVHEQMSPDQLSEIFETGTDSVPEYEVVQFHVPRVRKRDSEEPVIENLVAKVFGDDVKLWLKPAEGVLAGKSTPVHLAKINPVNGEVIYVEVPAAMQNVGLLLEDPVNRASLVQRTNGRGEYSYNGFIGAHDLVVKSLPESISESLANSSSQDSGSSEISKTAYHVVFKKQVTDLDEILEKMQAIDERRATADFTAFNSKVPAIPAVVYPEVLVVVDHNLFRKHRYSVQDVLMYVLAFWNGVDLLYRSFEEPKFRFNIARVVIGTEHYATPYFADNMHNPRLIDAFKAHAAAQKYFYSKLDVFPSNSYDAIVAMTGFEMTDGNGDPNTLGIALNGGACVIDHARRSIGSLALAVDDGTFHGVATTAHEFAHLLGSTHDKGDYCGAEDGYIMAPAAGVTENAHDFSVCTLAAIASFLRRNGGFCFYNVPVVKDPLPRGLLPGLLSDRDHQCKTMGNGGSCYTGDPWQLHCSAVYCYEVGAPKVCYQYKSQAPPDGAKCGDGKVCIHGKCLAL